MDFWLFRSYLASNRHLHPIRLASVDFLFCTQEEVGVSYKPITDLEKRGIAVAEIKKLKEAGFHTVESVAYASIKQLVAVKGITEQKAQKLLAEGSKLVDMGFLPVSRYSVSCLCGCVHGV